MSVNTVAACLQFRYEPPLSPTSEKKVWRSGGRAENLGCAGEHNRSLPLRRGGGAQAAGASPRDRLEDLIGQAMCTDPKRFSGVRSLGPSSKA